MQLVRIKQDNKNQKLKTIKGLDQGLYYRPQINKEDTFSQKMVNENQEVLVSSVLSKEKPSSSSSSPSSSPSTSIHPPRGQRQEPEKKISNSFEIELDPFTTVVLSQL